MDIKNSEEIIFHENLVALLMLKLSLSGADSLARGWGWELCIFFNHVLEALGRLNKIPESIHSGLGMLTASSQGPPFSL